MKNKYCMQYYKVLKGLFPRLSFWNGKFLRDVKTQLSAFSILHPNATYDDVVDSFGLQRQMCIRDRPTGALDSGNSRILMETFEMMNERLGATILLVTHDAAVGAYAGRVLFLKDGKIFGEVRRGSRSRQEMYREILSLTSAQGGDSHVG